MRIPGYPRTPITSAGIKVICHGNSHTAGEGASSTATRWTAMLSTLPPMQGKGITVINSGVGGQSITNMIANGNTAVDAQLDNTKLNVLFAQEFGNELADNGRDPVAAHNKWIQYCQARRAAASAAGARLYIITMGLHPTGAADTYAETLQRIASIQACNVLIRNNFRTYCDQFIDLAKYEPFASLYANGLYTEAAFAASGMYNRDDGVPLDRVHLGNAGHALLGRAASSAMKRIML